MRFGCVFSDLEYRQPMPGDVVGQLSHFARGSRSRQSVQSLDGVVVRWWHDIRGPCQGNLRYQSFSGPGKTGPVLANSQPRPELVRLRFASLAGRCRVVLMVEARGHPVSGAIRSADMASVLVGPAGVR